MKILYFFLLLLLAGAGLYLGKQAPLPSYHEKELQINDLKQFVLVVYAQNHAPWCAESLRSLFDQSYDRYRVIFIDDGSTDGTFELAQKEILASRQDGRVLLMRNEEKAGFFSSLYRAIDHCLDEEIVLILEAKDRLAEENTLSRLNRAYQNQSIWLVNSPELLYPTYEKKEPTSSGPVHSCYKALLGQVKIKDLFQDGLLSQTRENFYRLLWELVGSHYTFIPEPILLVNRALLKPSFPLSATLSSVHYPPLSTLFSKESQDHKPDLVLFSFDRPMQLFACLESIHHYFTGYNTIHVLYRVSNDQYGVAYDLVQRTFPKVRFIRQSTMPRKDFQPLLLKIVYELTRSPYIIFGVDDQIVKDYVDLEYCTDLLEKTGVYGVYLRLGRHINECYMHASPQAVPKSVPLGSGLFAWDTRYGEFDWGFPNTLDMTLYRKIDLKEALTKLKYKHPNSLEWEWARKYPPKNSIGLYFEYSKVFNLPLNIVHPSDSRNMNCFTPEDLLAQFNHGLKINILPFYKMENPSPHYELLPEFIARQHPETHAKNGNFPRKSLELESSSVLPLGTQKLADQASPKQAEN